MSGAAGSGNSSPKGPRSHRLANRLRADGLRRTLAAARRLDPQSVGADKSRKVLCIYTGGTIGMKKSPRGYIPAPGYFEQHLASSSLYHDPAFRKPTGSVTKQKNGSLLSDAWLVSAPGKGGLRTVYRLLEYDPLLDSCNMSSSDWLKIANDIYTYYDEYDAFIVLHGTDTMAYTASALSFILENLGKQVLVTGSQIPLSQPLSDGVSNLLGALACATQFEIPEVTLFFSGKLFRGNRCTKGDCNALDAFWSMNYPPLVVMGVDSIVDWQKILPPPSAIVKCATTLCEDVAVFRLFPGFTTAALENLLKPPMKGLILCTFGAGNAPDTRTDMLQVLRQASDRGVVIVNVTQCSRGRVEAHYATGTALLEAGVIPGFDMTTEAALAKLAYLLGAKLSIEDVRDQMSTDTRGELTQGEEYERISFKTTPFIQAVHKALMEGAHSPRHSAGEREGSESPSMRRSRTRKEMVFISEALSPVLLCSAANIGHHEEIESLITNGGMNPNSSDYDLRTPLHIATASGHFEAVKSLLSLKASVNVLDRWHISPLAEAARGNRPQICEHLLSCKATLRMTTLTQIEHLFQHVMDYADGTTELGMNSALSKLQLLLKCKADTNVFDYDKRRPLHVAAADGHLEPVKVLLSAKAEVNALDRWQCTPLTEAMRGGFDEICELLVACGGRVDGMTREEQRSFLWLAIDNQDKDDPEALRLARLLSCGIDVNCIDLEGRTVLHFAATRGSTVCVQMLLEAGTDPDHVDVFGHKAIDNARTMGHDAVVSILDNFESISSHED